MVLDPFSALGLAGNVLQFIDFCGNVISESRKTYQSASESSPENIELGSVAVDLQQLCAQLQPSNRGQEASAVADQKLAKTLAWCEGVAADLLSAIEQLKIKTGPHRKWRSFRQALITVWKKDKLSGLQRRLSFLREQVTLHLVSDLSNQQHTILANVNKLHEESELMHVDVNRQLCGITSAMVSVQFSLNNQSNQNDSNLIQQALQVSSSAATDLARELEILRSLRYRSMEVRHSMIAEAYRKTFDWIFNTEFLPTQDLRAKIGLSNWLSSKEGIFWISGKAGSGKSTLMKYISDDSRTNERLRQWAGDSDLITASFYFWNAGTDTQKSQQGLLQSLLYKILSQYPDLISTVCERRWSTNEVQRSESWKVSELSQSFVRLQSWASPSRKFCFFIDGLDEYDGDHFELVDAMVNIAKSPHIKLCLSSRPWNCFEDAFGRESDRKLYLQDLTREDIEIYVKSKLAIPVTLPSALRDEVQYQTLALEIVDRAQGVFLWVYLVVRSLQEGLANRDSIAMLQKKLQALPTDLELFFEHILSSVESVYKEKLAGMLQVALEASVPWSLMTYSFLDEDDPDFAMRLAPAPMTVAEIQSRQDDMRRRVNGRSKDNMRTKLKHMTSSTYNACFALSRALLAEYKTLAQNETAANEYETLDNALYFAQRAEEQRRVADIVMMDELERTAKLRCHEFLYRDSSFLEHAIKWGLVLYVDSKLSQQPQLLLSSGGFLLFASLQKPRCCNGREINLGPVVHLLLQRGLSPNHSTHGSTVWRDFLVAFPKDGADQKEFSHWQDTLRLLLLRGADVPESVNLIDLMITQALWNSHSDWAQETVSTVDILLSFGLDPNQPIYGRNTIWTSFLDGACSKEVPVSRKILYGMAKAFLRYGANSLACVQQFDGLKESKLAYEALMDEGFDITERDDRDAMEALIVSEMAYQRSRAQYHVETINK
ncbi:hypothetical protein H2200_002224 [Cladophialophora chaetospira]|uniref:NACHT domain-containing protein n=1 Tax=Cladophialophora chaetospira TaxID=386627 RepID=A0AA38XJ82_9EURO|nr:hypothetical protein H2200_002224 [Cladophialophora chaetospira]